MTKTRNARTATETASIVLKTLHNDILRDNPNATVTTKSMRVWLRANMNDVHDRNASWIFTQSQYDRVRSHFDPAYRARIERAAKRNAKSPDAVRVTRKRNAKSNDATPANVEPVASATVDA